MNHDYWMLNSIAFGAVAAIGVVVAIVTASRRYRPRLLDRVARRVGLTLPAELESEVAARWIRRIRFSMVGLVVGVIAAIAAVRLVGDAGSGWIAYVYLGSAWVGSAVGVAACSVGSAARKTGARVRLARGRAVSLSDYVIGFERWGARAAVGVSALAAVALAAISHDAQLAIVPLAISALGVCSLLVFEAVGRSIIARPDSWTTSTEIAWDDALRAVAVRDLATSPLTIGAFGTIVSSAGIIELVIRNAPLTVAPVSIILYVAFLAVLVAILVLSVTGKPEQHYLRRLWPKVWQERNERVLPQGGAA